MQFAKAITQSPGFRLFSKRFPVEIEVSMSETFRQPLCCLFTSSSQVFELLFKSLLFEDLLKCSIIPIFSTQANNVKLQREVQDRKLLKY